MISIVGAGPAGCLLAILLARRGTRVELYERRPDPAQAGRDTGRSINLALAARGIRALREAGVMDRLGPLLVPMRGRMVHEPEMPEQFLPYGQRPDEIIWSVERAGLWRLLTDAARAQLGVTVNFNQQGLGYSRDGHLQLRDTATGREYQVEAERIIGADGASSLLRRSLANQLQFEVTEERLEHDYKELAVPAKAGLPQLTANALHIWPRGEFMLIALPNADGSFTATLFLPRTGPRGFERLTSEAAAREFFAREFPDALRLIPDLAAQFAENPQGMLGTIRCPHWRDGERLLLIGDAAHAIVPFHGQGMNCAFEDCRILDALLARDPANAFEQFEAGRRLDCAAIATMALENYAEMRDSVRDPLFLRQKSLAMALEQIHPNRFIPRYSMVMFHDDIPYSIVLERGRIQQRILDTLTQTAAEPDLQLASRLIREQLPPVSVAAR